MLLLAWATYVMPSAQISTSQSFFTQWSSESDSILQWTIETDLKELLRNRDKEVYQAAKLTYKASEGQQMNWDINIRSRGNTRKTVCAYAPLKMKFKKSDLKSKGFHPFNKLKIVNQCKTGQSCASYLLKEFIIYRMYNLISPYSYRAHLVKIHYKDVNRERSGWSIYAILLEPDKDLERRLAAVEIKREESSPHHLANQAFRRMAIFQYMIGNTDWSVGNLHNLKIFKVPEERKVVPIPYDFDYAGLVNTYYAVPHESLPIEKVTQRLYRGPNCNNGESRAYIRFFLEKEEQIMDYCNGLVFLAPKDKKELINYLKDFFRFIERQAKNDLITVFN